jgi:hypothetical protein
MAMDPASSWEVLSLKGAVIVGEGSEGGCFGGKLGGRELWKKESCGL